MSAEVLRLVSKRPVTKAETADCVKVFKHLLQAAEQGLVVGAAYVVILKNERRYMADWCGTVEKSPTLALGAVNVLRSHLEDLILQMDAEGDR